MRNDPRETVLWLYGKTPKRRNQARQAMELSCAWSIAAILPAAAALATTMLQAPWWVPATAAGAAAATCVAWTTILKKNAEEHRKTTIQLIEMEEDLPAQPYSMQAIRERNNPPEKRAWDMWAVSTTTAVVLGTLALMTATPR